MHWVFFRLEWTAQLIVTWNFEMWWASTTSCVDVNHKISVGERVQSLVHLYPANQFLIKEQPQPFCELTFNTSFLSVVRNGWNMLGGRQNRWTVDTRPKISCRSGGGVAGYGNYNPMHCIQYIATDDMNDDVSKMGIVDLIYYWRIPAVRQYCSQCWIRSPDKVQVSIYVKRENVRNVKSRINNSPLKIFKTVLRLKVTDNY